MSANSQHKNIMLAVLGFAAVVMIVAVIGLLAIDRDPDMIQGQYACHSGCPGGACEDGTGTKC